MSSTEAMELEYVKCNLCDRDVTEPFVRLGSWQVVRCTHCDLKYLNPRPTLAQLAKLYSAQYFDSHYTQSNIEEQIQRNMVLVKRYEQKLKKKGCLLDVGCGYGFLIAAAQRLGWDAKGIDISEEAVAFGTTLLAIDIERAIPETWQSDCVYDVVVSSHSLEHVANPRETLSHLKSYLKGSESLLHIRVPNVGSFDRKWHGDKWWAWDAPFHLYFFEPKTLTAMLKQVGFQDIAINNGIFDPFSHLFADAKNGKFRNDGPNYVHRSLKGEQGIARSAQDWASRIYIKIARSLKLSKFLSDRDLDVWAKIGTKA